MKPREWKTYATVRHLDNLEVLKAVFYRHSYGRHYHDGYALGVILKGSETYDCNKTTHVAPKGSVVMVNPGEIHNGHASDARKGWGYFMIYPHLSLVRKALAQLGRDGDGLPVFPASVTRDRELAARLVEFMHSLEAGDPPLAQEAVFLQLLGFMISRHAQFAAPCRAVPCDARKVERVKEIIHSHYADPISLEFLAREVGLSAWSLLRLFKKQTGISPYLLQTRLKITHAKQALLSGHPPADAAALCGFSDQSHMTKQFRRWMGITPGDILLLGPAGA